MIVIETQENVIPGRDENVDMFVSDTLAVDVEPRVENPTVASTSTDVMYFVA